MLKYPEMWKRLRSRRSVSEDNDDRADPSASLAPPFFNRLRSRTISPRRKGSSTPSVPEDAARRTSQQSPLSSDRGLSPGPDPDRGVPDKSGLQVIYQPKSSAPLDIIFVHGLGGASRKTWSKYQDPKLFWPQQWLPFEPEICTARILSFGYDASFRVGGPRSVSNITDFAKDLLFAMKFGYDDDTEGLEIGKVPIIFVVHSMGGLVVKKAYLLGQNDENYEDIVKSISGIIFLATPHRGTDLAELLNKILLVSFQSPKNFIADLNKSSPAIEELNEQFRHVAPRLTIVSFYETLHTTIGPKKLMVLEKESSILGYPGEISKSLNADHHDVCKFTSPEDPNYVSVRNALKSLVGQFRSRGSPMLGAKVLDDRYSEELKDVEKLFAGSPNPEDDLEFFRQRWMPGTCDWVLSEPAFQLWLKESSESRVAWLSAPPASGKSILASHIIHHVRETGHDCQYFFFRFGDRTKRSPSALLRSLGSQIAKDFPVFRRELTVLASEGIKLEKTDARIIWQKVFVSILFKLVLFRPLYWVIDALDESDSPRVLLDLLQGLSSSCLPIRVLIISRRTESLSVAFDRLSVSTSVNVIQKGGQEHITADIRMYVQQEMKYMRGSDDLKRQIMDIVLQRADGNFLWVHLVLEEIVSCHTEQAIRQTLKDVPAGMSPLYQRMEQAIAQNPKQADQALAKTLLSWTICARRSLTLNELSQALLPEFPEFLDLKTTIQAVCGQFVVVDHKSHVAMVHQTARDYLTKTSNLKFSVDLKRSHEALFAKTLSFLLDPNLRSKLERGQHRVSFAEPFLVYAATSWTYHLHQAATASEGTLDLLVKFFRGPFILTWIHSLALFSQLDSMVKATRVLLSFVSLNRKLNLQKNPLLHRLQDLELLECWGTDLVKIVGKFGTHLLSAPTAIYKLIPPFCPQDSMIYQQFNQSKSSGLSISGVTNTTWNDCLARISFRNGIKARGITCGGRYFAVSSSIGTIVLYDTFKFEEICKLRHAEHITTMAFNSRTDKFVSYGLKTTKVWAVPLGQLLVSVTNPEDSKAMAITFTANDTKIMTGSDDKLIRYFCVDDVNGGWQSLDPTLLREPSQIDGGFITSPCCMAFNADATQIAVAYRGYPLSVWAINEPRLIGRCKRVVEHQPNHARPSVTWMAVDRVTWNPVTGHLLGLYKDGSIFKWNPVGDENQEVRTTADEIEASPDGRLFVTSDSSGTVKVWNFAYFSVIYQLSSESLVTGLAFSPDCRRFYDLRGSSITAWEPNSLIRFSDTEDALSETTSEYQTPTLMSQASEAWVASIDPICALAAAPRSPLFCAGNEDGAVDLFDKFSGKLLELAKFLNFLTVAHLAWGEDGRHIAAADLGGHTIVKRLKSSRSDTGKAQWEVQSMLTSKVKIDVGGIHQILLNRDSTMLLVISQHCGQIWSVEKGCIHAASDLENGGPRKWLNHPLQQELLLGFGSGDLRIYRWNDLAEIACITLSDSWLRLEGRPSFESDKAQNLSLNQLSLDSSNGPRADASVSKAMLAQDGKHLLVQISEVSAQGRTSKSILIFEAPLLDLSDGKISSTSLKLLDLSNEILLRIEVLLGILPGGRLVFLDKDMWVCTVRLGLFEDAQALRRHYFIPRDWASTECLEQCCMLDDGTFLCPKDGEVAVITNGLGVADW